MAVATSPDRGAILVCLDFSSGSEAALDWAVDAAIAFDVDLLALHVVHDPAEAPGFYVRPKFQDVEEFERVAAEMMNEFIASAGQRNPRFAALRGFATRIVIGLPVTRILEVIASERIGLVAMGAQGRTALADVLLGSKVERVVRLSPVSVTVVKPPQPASPDA